MSQSLIRQRENSENKTYTPDYFVSDTYGGRLDELQVMRTTYFCRAELELQNEMLNETFGIVGRLIELSEAPDFGAK